MNKKIILIILLMSLLFTACTNKGEKKSTKVENKDKAPKDLISILDELDKILVLVDEIEEISKLTDLEYESLNEKDKKTKEDEEKQKKEEQKEDEISDRDVELLKLWNNLGDKIDKVHNDWNNYEIESRKKSPSDEKSESVKNNLNYITTMIENRDIMGILDATSKSLLSLAYFCDLYKDDISGDLYRIKHYVLQAYLNPDMGKEILNNTQDSILTLRQKLEKDKDKLKKVDKLDLSIKDMGNSLNINSPKLLKNKKEIIFKNIDSLKE
ncbi:hypothetical protein EDD65_106113 [Keratinibaculum paraultunense]|uniref:Lipoprotein n=1 Tax=Keratinibaculum paraultunense TaxID=1278232 RepID=A0A4V6NZ51_9FIRM|nr:hypothetical protein [Keratinibaculum paraultunense]QQY79312.1 hypothetical protein JL105_08970 [Keratinibaculum paraultunense]TCS89447.1 hypothetical protein EDD65_106113 [Keratinibaculum paraultunense]